jgi:hypothetical protein
MISLPAADLSGVMNVANVIIAELMGEFISALAVRPVPGRPAASDSYTQSPQQNAKPLAPQPAAPLPETAQPFPQPTAPAVQAATSPVQAALDLAVQSALQRALTTEPVKPNVPQSVTLPQPTTVPAPPAQTAIAIPEVSFPKKAYLPKPMPAAPNVSSPAPDSKPEVLSPHGEKARIVYTARETAPTDNRSNLQEPVIASNVGLAAPFSQTAQPGQVTEWEGGRHSASGQPAFHIDVSLPEVGRIEVGMAIVSGKSLRLRIRSSDATFIDNLRGELPGPEAVAAEMGLRLDAVLELVDESDTTESHSKGRYGVIG